MASRMFTKYWLADSANGRKQIVHIRLHVLILNIHFFGTVTALERPHKRRELTSDWRP